MFSEKRGACHAGLTHTLNKGRETDVIVSYIMERNLYKELSKGGAHDVWIDYLVNRSPWSGAFIDKDVERIKKLGFVLRIDAPSNLLSAALTATRHLYEYPSRCAAFSLLRERLENENLAFLISLKAVGNVKDGKLDSLKWTDGVPEHTCMHHRAMSELGCASFCLGVLCEPNKAGHLVSSYYSPNRVWHLHCPEGLTNKSNWLSKELDKMPTDRPKSSNMFDVGGGGVEDAIEYAAQIAERFMFRMGI